MLKILILDDNIDSINLLKLYIQEYYSKRKETYTLKYYCSSEEFMNLDNYSWDLIFLDIEMPGIDGIELAKSIRLSNTKVILAFVTGHQKYLSESYKIHPFDYILKPFTKCTIFDFFDELYRYYFSKDNEDSFIKFNTSEGTINIEKSNIVYFEYINNSSILPNRSVRLVTKLGVFIIKQQIGVLFDSLDQTVFARPHQSFIINLENINSFKNNDIIMTNGDVIPISQKKIKHIRQHFAKYISCKLEKKL